MAQISDTEAMSMSEAVITEIQSGCRVPERLPGDGDLGSSPAALAGKWLCEKTPTNPRSV